MRQLQLWVAPYDLDQLSAGPIAIRCSPRREGPEAARTKSTPLGVYSLPRGACVHSARAARAQRAHDRKKLGVFATIGNVLAYADHTTPPQRWTA